MTDKLEGEHTRLPWKTDPNLDTLNSVEIWEDRIKKIMEERKKEWLLS